MGASSYIFYLISLLILGGAYLAVTTNKIFRAAIWLLFSLVGIAALYFWMSLEFIAAVQIIVYVGGIVVLIIFSVFLTQHSGSALPLPSITRRIFALLAVVFGAIFCAYLIYQLGFDQIGPDNYEVSVSTIGTQMLSPEANGFVLPFELVSILLLAAMIGCIVIAIKSKDQNSPLDTIILESSENNMPIE